MIGQRGGTPTVPTFLRMLCASASGIFDAFAGARPVRVWRSEREVANLLFSRVASKSLPSSSTSKGGRLLVLYFHFWCGFGSLWWCRVSGQGFSETGKLAVSRRDVPVRERPVAGLAAAQGVPLDVSVGSVQPPVLGIQEPLVFRELSVALQRLEPGVVAESEPVLEEEQVQVLVQEAPPEKVQALLALLLAQPVTLPRPPVSRQALRRVQEIRSVAVAAPLPQPVPLAGVLVLPTGLRAPAGAAILRLRPHLVP